VCTVLATFSSTATAFSRKTDRELASAAGWDRLPYWLAEGDWSYIALPEGTRNALSVLSAAEAYRGERASIIAVASHYLTISRTILGSAASRLSWYSMGRTPSGQTFVAPPHGIDLDGCEPPTSGGSLVEELELVARQHGRADWDPELKLELAKLASVL
jgi:hypothetical protein